MHMDIIKQKINDISDKLGKKIYIVNKIYKSTKINYKRLIIDMIEDDASIIEIDQTYDTNNKIACSIIITDEDFVIVGFNHHECVHIVSASQINKFPTSILYGHREEYGYDYDMKIMLNACSYEMFEIIMSSFDCPQILTSKENSYILQAGDEMGLIDPAFCIANNVMNSYYDKKKSQEMSRFSDFMDAKSYAFFCNTNESYLAYKNIFQDNPSIVPVQLICNNKEGYMYHMSIYNGIPIIFSEYGAGDEEHISNYDLTGDINQKRHEMITNVNEITDSEILKLSRNFFSTRKNSEEAIKMEIETTQKMIAHMQPLLDKEYPNADNTYKISNRILETRYDPKLLYNSDEIGYCTDILRVLNNPVNYNYYIKQLIAIDKFINIDNFRKQSYPYNITENNTKNLDILTFLKLVVGGEKYDKLLTNQPFLDNDNPYNGLNMYMGFVRISMCVTAINNQLS